MNVNKIQSEKNCQMSTKVTRDSNSVVTNEQGQCCKVFTDFRLTFY